MLLPFPTPSTPCRQAIPDISRAFEGGSTLEVVCLLRLLYNAHEAHPHTFTGLSAAGLLAGIARLAHRLDAASLLRSLHSFLLGDIRRIRC